MNITVLQLKGKITKILVRTLGQPSDCSMSGKINDLASFIAKNVVQNQLSRSCRESSLPALFTRPLKPDPTSFIIQ
jgi:hypothetical protein